MLSERIARAILNRDPMGHIARDVPDMAAAYDIQQAVVARLAPHFGGVGGYKIAWNAPAAYAPAVGHVFTDLIRQSGCHIPAEDIAQLTVEPEIIAVMGQDVASPGQTGESIAPMIARYHAGFEIMDRRNTVGAPLEHPPSIVANNVFNFGLVIGEGRDTLPEDMETVLRLDSEDLFRASNAAPQDPAGAVAFVANHLAERGGGLKAGDMVLCGTHYPPFVVGKGAVLEVTMGPLGRAGFSFG